MNDRVAAAVLGLAGGPDPVCAYVYDLAAVRRRVREVRTALPDWADLYYAVKANAHPSVVRALAPLVDGFEVGSAGEARLVSELVGGTVPLAFSGPAKTDRDLREVLARGAVQVNVESPHELHRVAAAAEEVGTVARVALRVNRPEGVLPGSHRMAGTGSQFGMDEDLVGSAVRFARQSSSVDLVGVHLHAVSNNTDAEAHGAFVADAVRWATELARTHRLDLRCVDVGGGVGVDYGGSSGFDLDRLALRRVRPPAGARVLFELGRYLVAEAGWYATEVVDVKRTHGAAYVLVRGGMHQFRLPNAWRMNHPFTVLPVERWRYSWPRPGVRGAAVTVAGELCTPRDVFAREVPVPEVRVGDVVVFGLAGAYGWEISHHDFLRHPHPEMVVLDG